MNLDKTLERITEPAPKASKVRRLSADEIAALQAEGKVTPPERIPAFHQVSSLSVPAHWRSKGGRSSDALHEG